MARNAYTISVYVLVPEDPDLATLNDIQAGIEATCGKYLMSGYLIETKTGIPAKVSDRI